MGMQAAITGWGWHRPDRVLKNEDLERLVDTDDAWIRSRTGIERRHLAGPEETTVSMGLEAARAALAQAELSPLDLDLIICTTTTPDHLLPSSACLIQRRLGADRAGAFDMNAACSGFLYGLTTGSQFIQAGTYRRVLVVASETLSRFTDWKDRSTCVLFGDGAGAVVLEATHQKAGLLGSVLGSRGDVDGSLTIEAGGSALPATADTCAQGRHYIRMRGNEVFKLAVRHMVQAAREALDKAGLRAQDIRTVIPHQANLRIIAATQEMLGLPEEQLFINVQRQGNTGASSVAMALSDLLEQCPARAGDHFLFMAFGGGFTWAATVLRWADLAAIRRERGLRLSA